jgi:hypothetical protein
MVHNHFQHGTFPVPRCCKYYSCNPDILLHGVQTTVFNMLHCYMLSVTLLYAVNISIIPVFNMLYKFEQTQ